MEEVGDPDGPGDSLAGGGEGVTRGKSKRPRGGKGNADAEHARASVPLISRRGCIISGKDKKV